MMIALIFHRLKAEKIYNHLIGVREVLEASGETSMLSHQALNPLTRLEQASAVVVK
jgi:hypothetical protein